jgi:hypothetical protein
MKEALGIVQIPFDILQECRPNEKPILAGMSIQEIVTSARHHNAKVVLDRKSHTLLHMS